MIRAWMCFVFFLAMIFSLQTPAAVTGWVSETRSILREHRYACRSTLVRVDEIVRDSHIAGHVRGLPQNAYRDFKVIFYVKTDRWYAHPYFSSENPQEGVHYARLQQDGTFRIPSVRRAVAASRLAVSVVPAPYVIRSQSRWLRPFLGLFGGVFKYSCAGVVVPVSGEL